MIVLNLKKTAQRVSMAVFVISSTFLVLLSRFVMKGVKLMLVVWFKFIDCIWVFVIYLVKWTRHFTLGPRRVV